MNLIFHAIATVVSVLGLVLFKYFGWVPLVLYLGYLIWQTRRKTEFVQHTDHVLLQIIVPKNNDKKELAAEQMFASLHGILRPEAEVKVGGYVQEHLSLEIASVNNLIHFFVWVPKHLKDYVEGQIYAQYPTVQIITAESDYAQASPGDKQTFGVEIKLTKDSVFPIKTFPSFEVDPLAGITSVLAKLEEGEQMWLQFLVKPVDDSWHKRGLAYVDAVKAGKTPFVQSGLPRWIEIPLDWIGYFFIAFFKVPEAKDDKPDKKEMSTGQTTVNAAIETKIQKLGYGVKIRACYVGDTEVQARARFQALVGGFKQYNTINLNGFESGAIIAGSQMLDEYRARLFESEGAVLNIEELASLYHLPHTSVETPNIAWITTKVGEPPANLPTLANNPAEELSLIGNTTFRLTNTKFGIKRADRARHLYIIGKSGVGKSFLLQLLALSDIYQQHGFAVVDPHGDFAQDIMRYIPQDRVDDVVYFNPADLEYPISFNPMENSDPNMRSSVASEIVGVLQKMFGNSWGPRLEHILRFTLLALLETPDATMLGITRMLTDKGYRKQIVANVTDPVVKAFWVNEFASWNEKFATEAVAPVLNKVGAFTANPLIRNVLGQSRSSFDIRKLMDEGKILIVDLSRGRIGEDNASILGALVITKIQLAAMSRANVPLHERRPFYLYVDEFQNFATESFAVILSEARKYGLFLTVANQYIAQMSEEVRDAVFGNVGSMVTFRVGAADATYLAKYFEPVFEPNDLVNLNIQNIYVAMSIDGETSLPFSAKTLRMPDPTRDMTNEILEHSRKLYTAKRADVEAEVVKWAGFADKPVATGGTEGEVTDRNRQPAGQNNDKPQVPDFKQKPNIQGVNPKKYSEQLKSKKMPVGARK